MECARLYEAHEGIWGMLWDTKQSALADASLCQYGLVRGLGKMRNSPVRIVGNRPSVTAVGPWDSRFCPTMQRLLSWENQVRLR